jgi:signal transduction histidine kinase
MQSGKRLLESTGNSALGDWQRMIVHDMKSPLAVILANLDLLSRCRLRDREAEFLESALKGCRDLRRLIQGYLRITRLGGGVPELELSVIPVRPFIRRLEGVWSVLGRGKGVRLECDLEGAPATLVADEHLLERLLSNLVMNAVAQVESDGRIGIRVASAAADRVRISVSDDGAGMPLEVMRTLAGRFSEDRAPVSAPAGVGTGLSFCRLACALHGGCLWAEGAAGGGTIVHAEFPADLVPPGRGLLDESPHSRAGDEHGDTRS